MKNRLAAVALGLAAALGALSAAVPAHADEPAVVDHADGEHQWITLPDVNQDQLQTNGLVDMVREKVLHALAGTPNLGAGASGPAGETRPGWAVMGEQGAEKIEG
ncbi:hypothetical protein [Streptomyces syringium]|uniref:hypothetical protein n=1 Tax=Streptomyces syringium TaxID=76729 RepID=UPI0034366006